MNDALASGAVAQVSSSYDDRYLFPVINYWFTVDHQVERFVSHPDGDNYTPDAYVYENPACTGPYRVEGLLLVLDGCPP